MCEAQQAILVRREKGWMRRVKYSANTDRGNLPLSSVVCVCGLPADVCVLQEHLYTIHLILRRFFSGLECFLACFSKYLAMFQLVKTSERAWGL